MFSADIPQLYCNILRLEHICKEHPFWLFSVCKNTPDPKVGVVFHRVTFKSLTDWTKRIKAGYDVTFNILNLVCPILP